MKKFKLMAIALVMGTTSLFATTPVNPVGSIEEIHEQITELIDNVNVDFDENKTVDLIFTFSSAGEIVVLDVDSNDREVIKFVRRHVNYKKIDNPGVKDLIYTVTLKIEER